MMKTAGIEREEVLLMLSELNDQLNMLESELHSSIEEYWNDWYGSQESRLEDCGKKLIALEESLRDLEKNNPLESRKQYSSSVPSIKLELGY
ncbi:hypothetical protein AB1K84_06785 [Mesobacillus foraminis]|nr:hypothetical protein [Mesobacillus foraminis]MBT2754947.1 hypothetical protein [Mesobacillus foraminis]